MRQRLYCLDASIYIFRAYYSRRPQFLSQAGHALDAVAGYLETLLAFLHRQQPQRLVIAFDESLGRGFREALYPPYKSRRGLPDAELAYQLQCCRALTEALGLACCSDAEFEADDLLASAAAVAQAQGRPVTVLSRDKDLAQILVHSDDQLQDLGGSALSKAQWQALNGLATERLADYLAVAGDRADDIPGLSGVGEKTAKRIFDRYHSLEDIFENIAELESLPVRGASRLGERFTAQREALFLYRQLSRLRVDAPLPPRCRSGVREVVNRDELVRATGGLPATYIDRLLAHFPQALNWQ